MSATQKRISANKTIAAKTTDAKNTPATSQQKNTSIREKSAKTKSAALTLGMVGLGKMGLNMSARLLSKGNIAIVGFNHDTKKIDELVAKGGIGASSVDDLIQKLAVTKNKSQNKDHKDQPRIVWLMLPNGAPTEDTFQHILKQFSKGDIIIDGGNSNFHDSIRRHKEAAAKGVLMLDVGVSGGVVAASRGYALMIGGPKAAFSVCEPIFADLSPAEGYAHVGEEGGAGHYVKMIHNAIEYGMMQAIAEGFDLMENGRFNALDVQKISHLFNHGTIVSSFLMEMVENALTKDAKLSYLAPHVDDNGEGRWAAIEAMEHAVPFVTNTYALHARYISRDDDSFAFKMLAAIRNEFGGHAIKDGKTK